MITSRFGQSIHYLASVPSIRALSSSTNKKPPPKPKPKSFKPIPSSRELLRDFLSPLEDSGDKNANKNDFEHTEKVKKSSSKPDTKKSPFVKKTPETVIKSKELLKDFLDMKARPKKAQFKQPASVKESFRTRYTEQLPEPKSLHLFDKSAMTKKGEEIDTDTYNNAVYDEIEALEMSTYRAKTTLNKFDELMQWTLDGKLWRYPIDNEQDWLEEQNTGFHEHVFLDRFIDRKSKKPIPLTAFMELVCAGLAQNPFITVNQKKEHLAWFERYFADKVEQIDLAVREEKRLSEVESKAKMTPAK